MSRAFASLNVVEGRYAMYLFPLAFLLNASAMTILLIAVGVMGQPELAADIAIVQGATLAVFFAFSANARSIILRESSAVPCAVLLRVRVFLMVPVGGMALAISLGLTEAPTILALALILRRCSEWISEIHLARMEREKRYDSAIVFIVVQSVLLVVAIVSLSASSELALSGLFLWALAPVALSADFIGRYLGSHRRHNPGWTHMLPHFGSTAITGITVFVFRLVILLIVGKAYAGDLFTAFALGGMLASVFAQALGPTLVFHAKEKLVNDLPRWLKICLLASVGVGAALVLVSSAQWQVLVDIGRPMMFWSAMGASLIGGAIMVLAQRTRLRLLQLHEDGEVFGPDLLTNIFIVACVPYAYYILGAEALNWLFFINAVIAFAFYASALRTSSSDVRIAIIDGIKCRLLIAIGLVLPLFFQLRGSIFVDKQPPFDFGGDILSLPIPISVLICYGAIVLVGNYDRARISLSVIFACFCLMIMSTVVATHGYAELQQAKIILLIQFILPMLALVLGQTYGDNIDAEENIAKAGLYVLVLVVPLELLATWNENLPFLSPDVYLFSVYQYLQYVPMVLICLYIFACFTLWKNKTYRMALLAMAIPIGAYAAFSISTLTFFALVAGSIVFTMYWYLRERDKKQTTPLLMLFFIAIGVTATIPRVTPNLIHMGKSGNMLDIASAVLSDEDDATKRDTPKNVRARLATWRFYVDGIVNSPQALVIGTQRPPDRRLYRSAHNYYLDFVYNFGLVSLIPLLWLIGFTLWKSGRYWKRILEKPELFVLTGLVLFLLFVDNFFKVGLRQPYPGIISFFLWGVLISRICELGGQERMSRG